MPIANIMTGQIIAKLTLVVVFAANTQWLRPAAPARTPSPV